MKGHLTRLKGRLIMLNWPLASTERPSVLSMLRRVPFNNREGASFEANSWLCSEGSLSIIGKGPLLRKFLTASHVYYGNFDHFLELFHF